MGFRPRHRRPRRPCVGHGVDGGLDAGTCFHAAHGGQLEILQWLRAEGCPLGRGICYHAVEQGHVEVLRWARENGCPWDTGTRAQAAAELGYTDDLGNLIDYDGNPI